MVKLTVVIALYVLVETIRGIALFPETVERQCLEHGRWMLMLGFPLVGWWIKTDSRHINLILVLALTGQLLGMLRFAKWEDVTRFHTEVQTGFQLDVPCSGLISATAILGILLFMPRIFATGISRWQLAYRLTACLLAGYLSLFALVSSQSRGTWIGLAITLPIVLGLRYLRPSGLSDISKRYGMIGAMLLLLLFSAAFVHNWDSISRRTVHDAEVMTLLLQGKTNQLPESSFAYRYHVQHFGIQKWLERPLLGWGTGSNRILIAESGRPELYNQEFHKWMGSMHNGYLELLVRFGVAGTLLCALTIVLATNTLMKVRQHGLISEDYYLFFMGSIALMGLWGLSSHYLLDGFRNYWLLLMGIIFAFKLRMTEPIARGRSDAMGMSGFQGRPGVRSN